MNQNASIGHTARMPAGPEHPNHKLSVVAGTLAGLLVLAGVAGVLMARPPRWRASGSLVVLPVKGVASADAAGYYETLSRGQIVETFAEVLRSQREKNAIASSASLSTAERDDLVLNVAVVPNTSVLDVSTDAKTAAVAKDAADALVRTAPSTIGQLGAPYGVTAVTSPDNATRSGLPRIPVALGGVLIAILAGVFVQQGVLAVTNTRAELRRRKEEADNDPPGGERDPLQELFEPTRR